jgi:cytochrome c553
MNARKLPTVAGTPARAGASIAADGAPAAASIAAPAAAMWTAAALVPLALAAALALSAGEAAAQEVKGDPKAAEAKIGACIGCHAIPGYKSSFPMVYSVPMINGQPAKYIENALTAYRSGDRAHPTMRAIAGSLTDQDIADLAAYYGKPLEKK